MRFTFIPREMKFFDMFDEAATGITRASEMFLELLTVFDNVHIRCNDLKQEERNCDKTVERIIKALDRSFITPFDREDIHELATSLDDVMDNMEEAAHRFEAFRIDKPTETAVAMGRIINECCRHLEAAIRECRNMKRPEEIQSHLLEIGRLENKADNLYRDSDSALFALNGGTDILLLIKWRELYSWLEETVDACKDTAHVISEIVIKGT